MNLPSWLSRRVPVDGPDARCVTSRVLFLLVLLFLALAFRVGLERGYDQQVGSLGPFTYAVSAVQTDHVYGIGRYAYLGPSLGHTASGLTSSLGWDWSKTREEISRDVDQKLKEAFSMSQDTIGNKVTEYPYTDLYAVGWGMDIGYVDFVDFAFRTFGFKVSSLYHFYFLVILVSVSVFCLTFSTRVMPLAVALGFTGALYAFLATDQALFFDLYGIVSPSNPRFISTFCILPALHVLFMLVYRKPVTVAGVAALLVQALILFFAMHGRTTATWALIAILGLSGLYFVAAVLSKKWNIARLTGTVIVLFVVVNIAGNALVSSVTHPVMEYRGQVPRHTLWTSVYCALSHHERWMEKLGEYHDGKVCEDAARIGARKYGEANLGERFKEYYNFEAGAFHSHSALDTLVKESYLKIAADDPQYVFESIVVTNGGRVYLMTRVALGFMLDALFPAGDVSAAVAGVLLVLGIMLAGLRIGSDRQTWRLWSLAYPCILVAFVMSFIPNWVVLVLWDTLLDAYLLSFVSLAATVVMFVAGIVRASIVFRPRLRERTATV